jgi:quinol monooxygenase YgiN
MAYVVSVTWTAKEGEADAVAAALQRMREPTLAEAGVQSWIPHRDPKDPNVFYIYEVYDDEASYTAHTETEHFQRDGFGDAIPRLADRQRAFYEPI